MNFQKVYTATDVHVAGEAFRIIKDVPFVRYQSLEELNDQFPQAYEKETKLLLNEPRGFAGLNGCLVVPPFTSEADAAAIFFNHEGTVPMQYGGVVAVITALLECGQLKVRETNEYKIETVSGVISVIASMENDEVKSVELASGPCRVIQDNVALSYLDLQSEAALVQADQLYAIFDQSQVPFDIRMEDLAELNQWGQKATAALACTHPADKVILLDRSRKDKGKIKTVTLRQDNYFVRSPGFGTTAAAITYLLSNSDLTADGLVENESIFHGKLTAELIKQTESGCEFKFKTRGFITGMQSYVLDPTDPLSAGFLIK
ncbi:proline racemase family protein [Pseudobacillus sp. 179-B 2D1 NHS]|uniref:proline racemase family protein n=1 Tax=Pseudobacillus sp. 179-B 2D1 NHS TaxID=3374292 RepID=UPI0038796F41